MPNKLPIIGQEASTPSSQSDQTPRAEEGSISIEKVAEDLRKQDGDLREQEKQIAALVAKEPFLATRDMVYVTVLKYAIPAVAIPLATVFAYTIRLNERMWEQLLKTIPMP